MNNDFLLEIIFEQLDESTAFDLANDLSENARLPKLDQAVSEITINTLNLGLDFLIRNTHLRILHYDSKYDVELNFKVSDIVTDNKKNIQDTLHDYAKRMADNYNIEIYYGGLEPAVDEDTRFFSGARRGPISL